MIKLLESSVDLLRGSHKHGEQYYWILYYSFLSPQQLKNTDEILEKLEQHIWNYDYAGGSNVIDVYIRYLRKKIDEGFEPKLIHTVRGAGYVLGEPI